jgi:hypothetical protein
MLQAVAKNANKNSGSGGPWGLRSSETFGLLCLVSLAVFFVQDQVVMTKELYYNLWGEQMTLERIDELLNFQAKWKWVNYLIIPLVLLVQLAGIAACLFTGAVLMDWKIRYRALFGLVVRAAVVTAMGKMLQTLVLLLANIRSLDDIYRADWFSLVGWLGKDNIPDLALVPASFVNVFELLFWVLLVAGVSNLSGKRHGLGLVAGTYGVGLVLWCLVLVYLQVSMG